MSIRGSHRIAALSAVVAWMSLADVGVGQTAVGGSSGAAIFEAYCATCHGTSGKGDGPLASALRTRPADLTLIATRNKGTFPADQVAQIIDGRKPVAGHGGGDMPAWGEVFTKSIDQTPVEEKIKRLVSYLASIQQKP